VDDDALLPFVESDTRRLRLDVRPPMRLTCRMCPCCSPAPPRHVEFNARRYLDRPTGTTVARVGAGAPTFVDATATEDGYWQFEWTDVTPGDLTWHDQLVRVEAAKGDGSWTPAQREGRW
jgi:hypothetical protein